MAGWLMTKYDDKISDDDRNIIRDIANKGTTNKERDLVWYKRWASLINRGLTINQLLAVFKLMSDSKSFRYEHLEYSARMSLWRAINDKMPKEFLLVVL
jgi:hypothetical protein